MGHNGWMKDFFLLLIFSVSWENDRYFGVMFYHHYFFIRFIIIFLTVT